MILELPSTKKLKISKMQKKKKKKKKKKIGWNQLHIKSLKVWQKICVRN